VNAIDLYRWMLTSRQFESALSSRNPRWFSTEGEEATIVGSFAGIREGDIAAPHYRGPFVTYLMRGADMKRLACQAFGKAGQALLFVGEHEGAVVGPKELFEQAVARRGGPVIGETGRRCHPQPGAMGLNLCCCTGHGSIFRNAASACRRAGAGAGSAKAPYQILRARLRGKSWGAGPGTGSGPKA